MAIRYTNTKDRDTKKINMVIYGRSGLGKTPWAASSEKPLLIDIEDGTASLEGASIPCLEARTWEDISGVADYLEVLFADKEKKKPKTVIIDSLTEASDILQRETELRGMTNAMQLYPYVKTRILDLFHKFKALPCHKIFICKTEIEILTSKLGEKTVGMCKPRLAGSKLTQEIPYLTDCLLYITAVRGNVSIAHAKAGTNFEAKDRYGMLPDSFSLTDKTAKDVIDLIAGNPSPAPPEEEQEKDDS